MPPSLPMLPISLVLLQPESEKKQFWEFTKEPRNQKPTPALLFLTYTMPELGKWEQVINSFRLDYQVFSCVQQKMIMVYISGRHGSRESWEANPNHNGPIVKTLQSTRDSPWMAWHSRREKNKLSKCQKRLPYSFNMMKLDINAHTYRCHGQ